MNETPAPSRRRGRPPKNQVITISALAPPQESAFHTQVESVQPGSPSQAPTVPSILLSPDPVAGGLEAAQRLVAAFPKTKDEPPLPAVVADDVDLREVPAMAARHSEQSSGSDSKAHGASDSYLPVEAGIDIHLNPALPEQSQALPEQERIPEPAPPITQTEAAPAAPVQTNWTPVQVGDVVQINGNSPRNKFYGALFIVGDIRNHRVHGYQIGAGGKLEYFTVNEDECILVGPSTRGQVRSVSGCSAKWKAENR